MPTWENLKILIVIVSIECKKWIWYLFRACHQDGTISDGGWRIYSNAPEGEKSFSLQLKKNESYLKYYPAKVISTADNNNTPPIPRPQ